LTLQECGSCRCQENLMSHSEAHVGSNVYGVPEVQLGVVQNEVLILKLPS
jgi:hypothetical protein